MITIKEDSIMNEMSLKEFELRLQKHHDELRWLYMELYDNGSMFFELCPRRQR